MILPYLKENERLFGITIDELLTVNGKLLKPDQVYRTIGAVKLSVLAGVKDKGSGLESGILKAHRGHHYLI